MPNDWKNKMETQVLTRFMKKLVGGEVNQLVCFCQNKEIVEVCVCQTCYETFVGSQTCSNPRVCFPLHFLNFSCHHDMEQYAFWYVLKVVLDSTTVISVANFSAKTLYLFIP